MQAGRQPAVMLSSSTVTKSSRACRSVMREGSLDCPCRRRTFPVDWNTYNHTVLDSLNLILFTATFLFICFYVPTACSHEIRSMASHTASQASFSSFFCFVPYPGTSTNFINCLPLSSRNGTFIYLFYLLSVVLLFVSFGVKIYSLHWLQWVCIFFRNSS
jgi:hypothetical protein